MSSMDRCLGTERFLTNPTASELRGDCIASSGDNAHLAFEIRQLSWTCVALSRAVGVEDMLMTQRYVA